MVELDRYLAPHRHIDSIDNGWPGFDNGWGYTDPALGCGPYAPVPTAAVCAVNPTPCGPVVTCNPLVTGPRPDAFTSLCGPAGCGPVPFHAEPIGRPCRVAVGPIPLESCGPTIYPTGGHYYGNGFWFYDDCGFCGCSSGSCCGHNEPIHEYEEFSEEEEEEFEEIHYYVDEEGGKRKLIKEVRLPRESSVLKNGNLRTRGRNLPRQKRRNPKTRKIVTEDKRLTQRNDDGIVYHHHHHFSVDTPKSERNLAPVVEYRNGEKHVHFYLYDEEEEEEQHIIVEEEEEEEEEREEIIVEEHIVHRKKHHRPTVSSRSKRYGLNGKPIQ